MKASRSCSVELYSFGYTQGQIGGAEVSKNIRLHLGDKIKKIPLSRFTKGQTGQYASIGLLEYFDAVGYELESAIAKNVYPDLCGTRELQQLVLDGLATGKTGQAAGQGLYDWSQKRSACPRGTG